MKKYYSNVKEGVLLYVVNKQEDINHKRLDLSPEEECLQVSCKKLKQSDSFRPHKHLPLERNTLTTNEAWVIIRGTIRAKLFDTDNTLYSEQTLKQGDCLICFNAGHSFKVLENDTILYEFKNGPYYGAEKDKEFI